MLREEHMDLFGTLANGVYSSEKAVAGAVVTGNVLEIGTKIPLFDVEVWCTEDFAGTSENITLTIKGSNTLSAGALATPVTIRSKVISAADLKKGLLFKDVLSNNYQYVQVTVTPDTASSHAFSAGKVAGYVVPEFN